MNFTNATLINEALRIVFQMSIIVCGSLVFCEIILRKFSNQIERVGQILNIDKYSVMGIILSFGTSIAMLPLFSKMNRKGKILNACFFIEWGICVWWTTRLYCLSQFNKCDLVCGCKAF